MSEATAVTKREAVQVQAPDAPEDVGGLIRLALEKQVPVEVLERLVALSERVSERNARAAFFDALARFRAECPPIQKTRENAQFSVTRNGVKRASKYAPLEEVDRVARPVAAECGLVWTWDQRIDGEFMHVTCRVLHVMGHSESSTVTLPHASNAGSSPQQKFGGTQSYGMRYSLLAALGLTTAEEDTDGAGGEEDGGGEAISDGDLADIEAKIREVGADRAAFLRVLGVERLGNLTSDRVPEVVRLLEEKRRRREERAAKAGAA
jgi:hypothetical protein